MSIMLNETLEKILKGINKFIAACINANRDFPFHDYNLADTTATGSYVVGSNNIEGTGDQKKHFVSKSTLLYASHDVDIRLNSNNNVTMPILAETWYTFKSNIHSIFWDLTEEQESYLKMYFEGVMYNEARRPQ